jgi:hypothetical protein
MAAGLSRHYGQDVEARMRAFFETLSEKDRRRYAAVEARRLSHGGIAYLAKVFGCSRRTIERGLDELEHLPYDPAAGRVRRPGGGRKKKSSPNPSWSSI